MRSCIYVTDPAWLSHLNANGARDSINFWRKDRRRLDLQPGDLFYFKPRGGLAIAGRGYFREQLQLPIVEAWRRFGLGNGVGSLIELKKRTRTILHHDGDSVNCLILDDLQLLEDGSQPMLTAGYFQPGIMNCKFFEHGSLPDVESAFAKPNPLGALIGAQVEADTLAFDPAAAHDTRVTTMRAICSRRGQSAFRSALLAAYRNQCCVTGETTAAVLEAAHIHPYRGRQSHHPTNGLILRSDWHMLFDLGLWSLSDDYRIMVSSLLAHSTYAAFEGQPITLPIDLRLRPSAAVLAYHRDVVLRS